jgi:hypothetical protein
LRGRANVFLQAQVFGGVACAHAATLQMTTACR